MHRIGTLSGGGEFNFNSRQKVGWPPSFHPFHQREESLNMKRELELAINEVSKKAHSYSSAMFLTQ